MSISLQSEGDRGGVEQEKEQRLGLKMTVIVLSARGKLSSTCYFGTARQGQAGEIEVRASHWGDGKRKTAFCTADSHFPILSGEEGSAVIDRLPPLSSTLDGP